MTRRQSLDDPLTISTLGSLLFDQRQIWITPVRSFSLNQDEGLIRLAIVKARAAPRLLMHGGNGWLDRVVAICAGAALSVSASWNKKKVLYESASRVEQLW